MDALEFYWEYLQKIDILDEVLTDMDNYGRPIYKQLRGFVSITPLGEGIVGSGFQIVSDWRNPNLTLMQKGARAGIIGIEDFAIDAASNLVGMGTSVAGTAIGATAASATGPGTAVGAKVGGAIGQIAGMYVTTQVLDAVITNYNPILLPGFFPE